MRKTISLHEAKTYLNFTKTKEWQTCSNVATSIGMNERTVRSHVLRLFKAGLLTRVEVFPGYRYQFVETLPTKEARAYEQQLDLAVKAMALT